MANTHSGTFDGTGDYARKTSASGLPTGSSARSIEAWVKTSTTTEQWVATFGAESALNGWELQVYENAVALRIEGANQIWTATNVTDGNWHHIAVTYVSGANINSATDVLAYMDGSALTSLSSVSGTPDTASGNVSIGAPPTSTTSLFNGQIDEVRIWDDVRTPTEISDNMSVELVGNEAGLVGYWKMNNDWTDETTNANDLTASGDATFSTSVPFTGAVASVSTLSLLGVGT